MVKRIISLAVVFFIGLFCLPTAAAGLTATPTSSTVLVNGKNVSFDAYYIGGSNYFKLRDLAYTLNGTAKQFAVGWDRANNAISLTSGMPYTPVGGEMTGGVSGNRNAVPTSSQIILDGKAVSFTAYNIWGNNYFKLRDIGAAFDFGVEWDGTRNTIVINTNESYKIEIPTLLAETEDMGQDYIDSIVFLGDSLTYGFQYYGVLSGGARTKQVWTPADRTFSLFNQKNIRIYYPDSGENITVESAVAAKKPEYMVITLGTNGVASMDEDYFKREYIALVTRILEASPSTKIILNSIFPVARNYGSLGSINNEKIERANGWVYSIAVELGVRYLDSASVLKDQEGWLIPWFQSGDGMHMNTDGYMAVVQYIRTHGYI